MIDARGQAQVVADRDGAFVDAGPLGNAADQQSKRVQRQKGNPPAISLAEHAWTALRSRLTSAAAR